MAGEHFDDVADFAGEVHKQPTLARADTVSLILDGEECIGAGQWNVVARLEMLLNGLKESGTIRPEVLQLLITKWDMIAGAGPAALDAVANAEQHIAGLLRAIGSDSPVFKTAARGTNREVPPGYGIPELVRSWLKSRPQIATAPRAPLKSRPFDLFG